MIFAKAIFGFVLLVSTFVFAKGVSAHRGVSESFAEARDRNMISHITQDNGDFDPAVIANDAAMDIAVGFDQVDFSQVSELQSIAHLNQIFRFIRDTKFMKEPNAQISERRLSWLYPDDGCYTRAGLASYYVDQANLPPTYKFFAFGNLAVKTANSPDGIVRWWYHVVPVYRIGMQAYVIDPAIDSSGPLKVEDWKKDLEAENEVNQFSVCKPSTVNPDQSCSSARGIPIANLNHDQEEFLQDEWNRLVDLNRDPKSELGDQPPWARNLR
jgi:hypothetical protein